MINNTISDSNDRLLSYDEAAKFLHCSKVYIWKQRKEGKLSGIRVARKVLFRKSELDAYVKKLSE